jgi:hypothetical protein
MTLDQTDTIYPDRVPARLDTSGYAAELVCPACGPMPLHYEGSRPHEHDHRDGLALVFSCEGCGDMHVLLVINEHGSTQLWWDDFRGRYRTARSAQEAA